VLSQTPDELKQFNSIAPQIVADGQTLFASAHFRKMPNEQDHQSSDNSENGHFYPAWNGHDVAPSKLGGGESLNVQPY
jgi:hypothetical protein